MNVGRGALAGCCALAVLILIAAIPGRASAQDSDDPAPSGQIWGDFRMVWPDDEGAWLFRIDLKPKVQFSGSEKWAKIVIDPAVEYSALRLLDLLGDLSVSYTLVPRIGARLHLISDVRDVRPAGRLAKRVGLATTVRLEHRHFWYYGSGSTEPYSNDWRLRIRLATRVGLNDADRSRSGAWYVLADAEAFVSLGDQNPGRFELLYIHDITRNTLRDDFDASVNAIDLRAHRFF